MPLFSFLAGKFERKEFSIFVDIELDLANQAILELEMGRIYGRIRMENFFSLGAKKKIQL